MVNVGSGNDQANFSISFVARHYPRNKLASLTVVRDAGSKLNGGARVDVLAPSLRWDVR